MGSTLSPLVSFRRVIMGVCRSHTLTVLHCAGERRFRIGHPYLVDAKRATPARKLQSLLAVDASSQQMARGRVALAPGCNLSAWMRLSKGDLTGGVGRCDEDDEEAWPTWSLADVATHNSTEDSWMAVRGKVACAKLTRP